MKRFAAVALLFLLFPLSTASAADPAAIAVAAEGPSRSSRVSEVAARAPYFLLFDEKGALLEAAKNPHMDARGGAGTASVDFLAAKGVKTVLAGAFGPRMARAMEARGMHPVEFRGTVEDAVMKATAR